jgi:hypothetical protein
MAKAGFVPERSAGLLKLRLARHEGRESIHVGRVSKDPLRASAL